MSVLVQIMNIYIKVMKQEHKELLLKDLSARVPYGVKILIQDIFEYSIVSPERHVLDVSNFSDIFCFNYEKLDKRMKKAMRERPDDIVIKPYLFPLSSMTEEQRIELYKVLGWGYESHYHLSKETKHIIPPLIQWEDFNKSIDNNDLFLPASWVSDLNKMYNWFNKNKFDINGLIPRGLAIDATGLNIY